VLISGDISSRVAHVRQRCFFGPGRRCYAAHRLVCVIRAAPEYLR
jgi:hypothetical protein